MSSIKTDSAIGGQTSSAKKTLNTAIALCGKRGGRTSILKGAVKIDGKIYNLNPGVQIWNRRGKNKLMVRVSLADGRVQSKTYDVSVEGIKAASNLSVTLGKSAAADILGHSERMLIRHYRRAMTAADAEDFLQNGGHNHSDSSSLYFCSTKRSLGLALLHLPGIRVWVELQ